MDRDAWIGNQLIVNGISKNIGVLALQANDSNPHVYPAVQVPPNPSVLWLTLRQLGAVLLEGLVYAPTSQGTWPMWVLDKLIHRAQRRLRHDFTDS